MVRGYVSQLHVLFGFLSIATAIPAACGGDKFEGCQASRTCPPPKGGEAGAGGDGVSGDTSTGGGSGAANTGGNSGTGLGGQGGSNGEPGGEGGGSGAGTDSEPPTIVSFTPADGDVDVERDSTVTVTFSEAIDDRTVTETSVSLSGPNGKVSGTLRVDENVISFVPERKLNLLGTYVLGVDETIADLEGNSLRGSGSAEFRVRDGRWSQPEFPLGNSISRTVMDTASNPRGDLIVVIGSTFDQDAQAAAYDADTGQWSPATQLPGTASGYLLGPVAIDAVGRGVVSWTHDFAHHLWHSTDDGDWDEAPLGDYSSIAVTSSGLAVAAWWTPTGVDTLMLNLEDGSQESGGFELPGVLSSPRPITSQDRVAIVAVTHSSANGDELWITWKDGSTWNEPERLASAPVLYGPSLDSDEQGNMVVIWREDDRVWSRIYEREHDAWTSELLVAGTATPAVVSSVAMTAGRVLVSLSSSTMVPSTWAAVYQPDVGWSDASFVLLNSRASSGSHVALDSAGNGIATWTLGGDMEFRRYVADIGWQEPSSLTARLRQSYVWAAPEPDGSLTVVANEAVGTQYAPWVVRFE
jgi:hypothetical protein